MMCTSRALAFTACAAWVAILWSSSTCSLHVQALERVYRDSPSPESGNLWDFALQHYSQPNVFDKYENSHRWLQTTNSSDSVCNTLQQHFPSNEVDCSCTADVQDASYAYNCTYLQVVCNDDQSTCARPSYSGIVDYNITNASQVIITSTCLADLTLDDHDYDTFCTTFNYCTQTDPSTNQTVTTLCNCTATYGNETCDACQLCTSGMAVIYECTNLNPDIESKTCQDFNETLGDGNALPHFEGSCTALENLSTDQLQCDCATATKEDVNTTVVSCQTVDRACSAAVAAVGRSRCKDATSTVELVNDQVSVVTTCSQYDTTIQNRLQNQATSDSLSVCTRMEMCQDNNSNNDICNATVTIDGEPCITSLCDSGAGISINCSNTGNSVINVDCQDVNRRSSFGFVPQSIDTVVNGTDSTGGGDSTTSGAYSHWNAFQAHSILVPVTSTMITMMATLVTMFAPWW